MSNYYSKQSAKVAIMSVLAEKGWKIYGYKPDQSDMMTDYWSPAHWDGVATKNGFVLLVDQYSTHYSGYEVKKYNHNVKGNSSDIYNKIEKLKATLNDPAASENEKEICQRKIEALENKTPNQPTYTVLETYPTFSYPNPKSCTWHIEKDGEIIAKGKGLTTVYETNSRENTRLNAEKFVSRIEKHIADDTQLEKVITKTVKKVVKPVEVTDRTTIQKGDILSFDYHGHVWEVISVNTRKDGTVTATYEILGSAKRGYQKLKNGKRYYDYMTKLEKNVQEGRIKIHTMQEVEEIIEKVSYKKTARKQKVQEDNLLQTETTPETPQQTETVENKSMEQNEISYRTGTGSKGNGIEITFTSKPSEEIRNQMKAAGYRWGGKQRKNVWWAILTDESLEVAKQLTGENDTIEEVIEVSNQTEQVEETTQNETKETIQNESPYKHLIGRKVFGQWGVMAGWDDGTIVNVQSDSIGTDIIIKWDDREETYRTDMRDLITVDDYTNLDAVGLYLMPIEETTPDNTPKQEAPETHSKPSNNVIDFTSKLQSKQEQHDKEKATEHILQNILPYMDIDDFKEMKEVFTTNDPKQLELFFHKMEAKALLKMSTK